MTISGSGFVASSLAVPHNAVKSILFRIAEILLGYTVFKLFSLAAARTKKFAAYLMFNEDLFQKGIFIGSSRFSGNGMLVLGFTIAYSLAQLYGTLLWALDGPGYILQNRNVSAASLNDSLIPNPDYILSLTLRSGNDSTVDDNLPQTIGSNLYKAGANFTLTGAVDRGTPQVVRATRPEAGGRIWLDNEGWSVSPDTAAMVSYATNEQGNMVPLDCPVQILGPQNWAWNCTFNNTFVPVLLQAVVGRPEVHWEDESDKLFDSRYVHPNRQNNIWASYGAGGGTVAMKQMFTVTKGTRRHTFIENVVKFSMVTPGGVPFARSEVTDFVKRTWSTDPEEQQAPLVGHLIDSMLRAQDLGQSYTYGGTSAKNVSTSQVQWDYFISEVDGVPTYSIVRISVTTIALIRSETIAKAPAPFETCDRSFQNEAEGGRVVDTDCTGSSVTKMNPHFFGQVDVSAVVIIYGLGDGRSNISSEALDQSNYLWLNKNSDRVDELLVSRGFIVSIDPALVTVKKGKLTPAISQLQLVLVLITIFAAPIGYFSLSKLASPHWANSFLSILLTAVGTPNALPNPNAGPNSQGSNKKSEGPGYIRHAPDMRLWETSPRGIITIDGAVLRLDEQQPLIQSGVTYAPNYYDGNGGNSGHQGYEAKDGNVRAEEIPLAMRY